MHVAKELRKFAVSTRSAAAHTDMAASEFSLFERYNDFVNDPMSRCTSCDPPHNAANAISARGDLNPANGTYPFKALSHLAYGGTDAKVVNSALFWRQQFYAVSGPTWDDQPPFRWSTSGFNNVSHVGHPDLWNFKPVLARWAL
ncbi:putative phospholipase B-like 2 [Ixodes scapularis]